MENISETLVTQECSVFNGLVYRAISLLEENNLSFELERVRIFF